MAKKTSREGLLSLGGGTLLMHVLSWCSDGLHLTPEGNVKVFEELRRLLEEFGLQWDKLPWDFPEPINIDKENPARTFGGKLN